MQIEIFKTIQEVAMQSAKFLLEETISCLERKNCVNIALSGGKTPYLMLQYFQLLINPLIEDKRWKNVRIFQVDERIAPNGHSDRNLTHLYESLSAYDKLDIFNSIYPMPVHLTEDEMSTAYDKLLQEVVGYPTVFDIIHLGLGADGHTASLIPNDPILQTEETIGITQLYQGRKRLTITYKLINSAKKIIWIITGPDKKRAFQQLKNLDTSIPAGKVNCTFQVVFTDLSCDH